MPNPWSISGSLTSDRLNPHLPPSRQQQQQQSKGKGKGKATPELAKSKAIRTLEARLDGARGSDGLAKDPKGGCFCQARKHVLSSYVSMCRQCGLALCTLNTPHYACPHCNSALLDERAREAMVVRLEVELAMQIAKEEVERQKAIEDARAAEGAFPMLPGSQMARTSRTPPPPTTTRTVLSLNSETKKVMVSSYSTQATVSRPASRREDREEEGRVPAPPGEVSCLQEVTDPGRPWRNVRAGDVRYIPLALPEASGTIGTASKRGRRKKGSDRFE